MKRCFAVLLSFLIVISVAAPAMAEKDIYTAYVYYDDNGLPKYWLDFTGSVADNLVLHCFFETDTWYETCYILDFNSAVPNSHQDTYRIENVFDSKGVDISNWFKTISLVIYGDSVSLYIERNPATLAGGPGSTILDGFYEMSPANAGVVYEYIDAGSLVSWLVLNSDNAELHFSDGKNWYLDSEISGEYTKTVTSIISDTGDEVPFQGFDISYVQGAMLLNADVNENFSGVFLYNPRTFLQRNNCSPTEIGRMAQMYYNRHNGFYPPVADVEETGEGLFSVHLYEMIDNGDSTYHTATSAWYTVDASGIGTDDIFGNRIDLKI